MMHEQMLLKIVHHVIAHNLLQLRSHVVGILEENLRVCY
jgi:hypothetical protein